MPQPELADQADALAVVDVEADAVHRAEHIRFGGRPAAQHLLECAAEAFEALARILFHQLVHFEQRLAVSDVEFGNGCADRCVGLRQQVAKRNAGPRRRAHQLACILMRRRSEDGPRCGGFHHVPLFHHDDPVAIGRGEPEIVGDQDRRHAALASQFHDQFHHRLLGGDVETGGRLVGDQELRAAGERQCNDDALAHASGKLERIGVIAFARPRDPHLIERLDRLLGDLRRRRLDVLEQDILDLMTDLADRIERRARVLEDHRDFTAAQAAHLVFAGVADVDVGEHHRAVGDPTGTVENAHHRIGSDGFPRTGFADDADGFTLGDSEVHMLHRLDDAAAGHELHRQVAYVEQRDRGHDTPSSPPLRIDDVAQSVTEKIEAEHRDHQCDAGKEGDPPFA